MKKELSEAQLTLIKKPLPKEAVKPHPTKTGMSAIKAIFVTERLNEVFGVGGWTLKTALLPVSADGSLFKERTYKTSTNKERTEFFAVAKTIFEVADHGIYYECIAGASNDDMGDAAKGATTDCITKICSYIGIGIDVFKGEQDKALAEYEREEKKADTARHEADVKAAIADLADCKSVADLTRLKTELSAEVKKDQRFIDAATARYHELNNQTQPA